MENSNDHWDTLPIDWTNIWADSIDPTIWAPCELPRTITWQPEQALSTPDMYGVAVPQDTTDPPGKSEDVQNSKNDNTLRTVQENATTLTKSVGDAGATTETPLNDHSNSSSARYSSQLFIHARLTQTSPVHIRARSYICAHSSCTRSFRWPKDLRRHEKVHSPARALYCPYVACDWAIRGFKRQDNLARHLKRKHGVA